MEDTKQLPFLSEVIDYEKDIEPYKLILLHSGVGSGKNFWVQTLAEQGMNVLFITSRKITAEVQAKNIRETKLDLEAWHRNTIAGKPVGNNQYLISRTNAWINHFARNIYDPEDISTHIWEYFDFIFLDEAHSVVTDATFADSSFQVWRFMSWVLIQKKCKSKVILMSGTPEPLMSLIPKKTRDKDWFNYIDYFEKCNHVEPKTVIIRHENKTAEAAKIIKKYHEKGQRIIYFTSSITNIIHLIEDLGKFEITEDVIGVSFTDEDKKDEFSDYLLKKKEKLEEALKTVELLPDDVRIFLTTTKNKEGINIQNTDIKIMFAESSQQAELKQMAGRVRNGLDGLIVMYNLSRNHYDVVNKWRRNFARRLLEDKSNDEETSNYINSIYNGFVEKNDSPSFKQVIADIESNFPYLRFDFFRQKFLFFEGKQYGEDLATEDRKKLEEWIKDWDNELTPGNESFQEWFPYSEVSLAEKPPTDDEIKKKVIEGYFKEHGDFLERVISKEERDTILKDLNTQLKEQITGYQDIKQLKTLLKKGGYEVKETGKHGNNQFKILLLTKTDKAQKD